VKKVVLMANKKIGLEVAKFLVERCDHIVALFLTGEDDKISRQIKNVVSLNADMVFIGIRRHDEPNILSILPDFDYIITVYWPYLLKKNILSLPKDGSVNFHPAMLPVNQGWYPHVFNILEGSEPGVTLHVINSGIDTGPIWAQSRVKTYPYDTADTLYYRLQSGILELFKKTWPKICNNSIMPIIQNNKKSVYHSIDEVKSFDEIDLNKNYTGREIIDILRARTFLNRGYAYFFDDIGRKIYIRVSLNE